MLAFIAYIYGPLIYRQYVNVTCDDQHIRFSCKEDSTAEEITVTDAKKKRFKFKSFKFTTTDDNVYIHAKVRVCGAVKTRFAVTYLIIAFTFQLFSFHFLKFRSSHEFLISRIQPVISVVVLVLFLRMKRKSLKFKPFLVGFRRDLV